MLIMRGLVFRDDKISTTLDYHGKHYLYEAKYNTFSHHYLLDVNSVKINFYL